LERTVVNTSVTAESGGSATQRPDQRLGQKYRFDDPNMDLFFVAALGWGPAGGLDIGQAFYVASTLKDGDADSWMTSFSRYAELQTAQADAWSARGWRRAAGETRLKAFAAALRELDAPDRSRYGKRAPKPHRSS
jgi:hypothetical protein